MITCTLGKRRTVAPPAWPQTDFVVSPSSLLFLVEHGLDLNYLVTDGIPFRPVGEAAPGTTPASASKAAVRPLVEEVGDQTDVLVAMLQLVQAARAPLVVHNGLLDLVFLYHALVGALPQSVEVTSHVPTVANRVSACTDGVWRHGRHPCRAVRRLCVAVARLS